MQLHRRFHTQHEEVDRSEHRGDHQPAHYSGVDAEVKVVLAQVLLIHDIAAAIQTAIKKTDYILIGVKRLLIGDNISLN